MKPTRFIANLLLGLSLLLLAGSTIPQKTAAQAEPPVLAFYYAWFDQNTWSSGKTPDTPLEPYNSADLGTIEQQVSQAQSAGINAFVQSWYGPQEANNQTETNFRKLLDVATAKGFKAAVDVETTGPFFGDAGAVTGALTTLLATHTQHPAYLRYRGKPVIFFWRQERFSVDQWSVIRNQVDPDHTTYWIAEGVDISYQAVFDGHHLYNIAWAASPADQLAKWGSRVRAYAADNQTERLWVATAMPGYNDTRLPRENTFALSRRNGDYYRETWRGAVASQPDMIIVTSFNEWLEGTQIEPGASYGNLYLDVTRELVTELRGNPPPAPAAIPAAQEVPPEESEEAQEAPPDGPYISVEAVTNVRSGPGINFATVGALAPGSTASVIGQNEAKDWWQIEFADAAGGVGWVSAEVVEFAGDSAEVPVVETPTPEATSDTASEAESAESTGQPATRPTVNAAILHIPDGGVNVRNGPGLEFDLLGRLDEGESVAVVAQNETGEWWQIEFPAGENGLAWVADVVVDFVGDPDRVPIVTFNLEGEIVLPDTPTPTPTVPIIAGSVEALDAVNVRSEPSLDGARVGGLYLGERADVLAVSEDGAWWQIEFPAAPDGTGWLAAEFARFQGDRETVPIFGVGTVTPTPGPTNTPAATQPAPSPTLDRPATFAPTATSIFQATSAALLAARGTPDPSTVDLPADRNSPSIWSQIPWGILSLLLIAGFLWYQFNQRKRGQSRRS